MEAIERLDFYQNRFWQEVEDLVIYKKRCREYQPELFLKKSQK